MNNGYERDKQLMDKEFQQTRQPKLKRAKRAIIATSATIIVLAMLLISILGSKGWSKQTQVDDDNTPVITEKINIKVPATNAPVSKQQAYQNLQKVLNTKLETYNDYYTENGIRTKYKFAREEDVLDLSLDMAIAMEAYFESCGAKHWTSNKSEQFWPKDIEYIMTAIASRESDYRTNITHQTSGAAGITQVKDYEIFPTVGNWLNLDVWEGCHSHINFEVGEVDLYDPATCIAYSYYNVGYLLANRLKQEKTFTDIDGQKKCIWDTLNYSEELQNRLIIAMYKYGIGDVTAAIYNRPNSKGKLIPLDTYIYGGYVEDIMDKTQDLMSVYENNQAK